MARKSPKRRTDSAPKAFTGDDRNMRSASRGGSRFPTLYYGDNGKVLPCLNTLSYLDYYQPNSVGRYDDGFDAMRHGHPDHTSALEVIGG